MAAAAQGTGQGKAGRKTAGTDWTPKDARKMEQEAQQGAKPRSLFAGMG